MDRIAEIKARCEAATPGAWYWKNGRILTEDERYLVMKPWYDDDRYEIETFINHPDADFIAHAREDIPYLLEQLEEAQRLAAAAVADLIFVCGMEPSACDDSSICDICAHQDGCQEECCMNATGGLNRWEWRGKEKEHG